MSIWLTLVYLSLVLIFLWPFRWIWFGKEVWVQRHNPDNLQKYGDLIYDGSNILVQTRWKKKSFSISQIEKVKAYSETNWGLIETELVSIRVPGLNIMLDADNPELQAFAMKLLKDLKVEENVFWGFLPQDQDSMSRDVLYCKKVSC